MSARPVAVSNADELALVQRRSLEVLTDFVAELSDRLCPACCRTFNELFEAMLATKPGVKQ